MYNSLFWKDVFERMIATVAQVLLALFTADGFDLLSVDFTAVVVAAVTAAVLVLLKAVVAASVNRTVSPASLAKDNRGV